MFTHRVSLVGYAPLCWAVEAEVVRRNGSAFLVQVTAHALLFRPPEDLPRIEKK
jgi:hypothetical protein